MKLPLFRCIKVYFRIIIGSASKTYNPFFSVSNDKNMTSENSIKTEKGNNGLYQHTKRKGEAPSFANIDILQFFASKF